MAWMSPPYAEAGMATAATTLRSPPSTPGMPWRLWMPHVSCLVRPFVRLKGSVGASINESVSQSVSQSVSRVDGIQGTHQALARKAFLTWRSIASARKGWRLAKPAVEMLPARRPMQRAPLCVCMCIYVCIQIEIGQEDFVARHIGPPVGHATHPGWIIMLQVEPTATPPASVAFWTSTMEKCPRRRLEQRKVATQLPGWVRRCARGRGGGRRVWCGG